MLSAALLLAGADAALACGEAKHASATKRGADGRAPLVIGDSVLLGAVPQVAAAGFEVDTRGCRQMREGLRVLGLVTPRELGGGSGSDARVVRVAGRRFPGRVQVFDWVRHSAGRRGWFAGDGIHLGRSGASGLARLLRRALAFATAPLCP